MKSLATTALTLTLSLVGATAFAGEAPTVTTEANALALLHVANQNEIAVGQLAEAQGTAKEVHDYASMLVTDHTQSDKDVQALADQLSINLMTIIGADTSAQQAQADGKTMLAALTALSGADFDKTFAQDMYDGHIQAIDQFTQIRSQLADSSPVAKLIDQTMPTLVKHRDEAKAVLAALAGQ